MKIRGALLAVLLCSTFSVQMDLVEGQSYRYIDESGNIFFVDRIDQIPPKYRYQVLPPTPIPDPRYKPKQIKPTRTPKPKRTRKVKPTKTPKTPKEKKYPLGINAPRKLPPPPSTPVQEYPLAPEAPPPPAIGVPPPPS